MAAASGKSAADLANLYLFWTPPPAQLRREAAKKAGPGSDSSPEVKSGFEGSDGRDFNQILASSPPKNKTKNPQKPGARSAEEQ